MLTLSFPPIGSYIYILLAMSLFSDSSFKGEQLQPNMKLFRILVLMKPIKEKLQVSIHYIIKDWLILLWTCYSNIDHTKLRSLVGSPFEGVSTYVAKLSMSFDVLF